MLELRERSLHFSRIFFPTNKVNMKIPLVLRRTLCRNPNIAWNINSDWPFCLAFGICTKPISSAVPNSKNNLIAILWKFIWSSLESMLCIFLFSRFVCRVTIRTKRKLPKLTSKNGIMYTTSLAWKGEIQQ